MSSPQAGPSGACDAKADNGSLPDDVAALRLALSGYDTTNLSATAILNQEVGAILDELEELEVLLHAVEEPAAAAQILAFCDQAVMGVTHVTERVVAMIEYIPDVAVKETLVERLKVLRELSAIARGGSETYVYLSALAGGILLSWEGKRVQIRDIARRG